MSNFNGNDPFFNNDMDDVFNQLFRRMDNQNSERARYLVNGQSLTPDEFAQYRATGKLPQNNKTIEVSKDGKQAVKKGGILEKLGTNLTEQARDGLLDPVIGRENEIQETAEILSRRTKNNGGHGAVRTEHGMLPLPAPATLELLRGVPTLPAQVAWETVTPTGAAILRCVVDEFLP